MEQAGRGVLKTGTRVVDAVAGAQHGIGIAELARHTGLPKSTAHRLAGQLIDAGMCATWSQQIKQRQLNPAVYNPPGFLCSPDSVATYFDEKEGEGYIAIADQCNYRIVVYRWSEIVRAAGLTRRRPAVSSSARTILPRARSAWAMAVASSLA